MSAPFVIAELTRNARERVRVALEEWHGQPRLDIRTTTRITEATDIWSPTKKGISLSVTLIPVLRQALADAEAKARELGLIE